MLISVVQSFVFYVMGLVAFGLELWALIDCLRHKPNVFEAASKRTKQFWLALTCGAAVVGGITVLSGSPGGLGLFGLIAVTAASVYLADVRPAVKEIGRGGNRSAGPYGPW